MTDIVEIEVEVITVTTDAILVESLGDNPSWIPKTLISDQSGDNDERPDTIFIPQWLAEEKELV